MWPSATPISLYQPIKNDEEDHEDDDDAEPKYFNAYPKRQHPKLAPKAPIPQHLLMTGGANLQPKSEQLLGGNNPIKQDLLMGPAVPIKDHLLLSIRREPSPSPPSPPVKRENDEEEGLMAEFDHVEDGVGHRAGRTHLPSVPLRKAVMLATLLVFVICLAAAAGVYFGGGESHPLTPADY